MPEKRQLGQLVTDLRHLVKQSANTAHGQGYRDHLVYHLQFAQRTLYNNKDWPYLVGWFSKPLVAGSTLYDPPANINVDRIFASQVTVEYDGAFFDLQRGITKSRDHASFDPDDDERSEPAQRWDIRNTAGAVQIEIWPEPVSDNTQTLWVKGVRTLDNFVNDSDQSTLDGDLIALQAAIDMTSDRGEAQRLGRMFQKRMDAEDYNHSRKGIVANFAAGPQVGRLPPGPVRATKRLPNQTGS